MIVNWKLIGLVVFTAHLPFLESSCPKFDKYEVTYDVSEKLDGKITHRVLGFRYIRGTYEERKKKMEEFYAGGYKEETADIIKLGLINNAQVEIFDKTDTKCNVLISGTFDNLVRTLTPTPVSGDFTFRKEGDRLTIIILGGCTDEEVDCSDFTISLKYAGEIIKHNAHKFDEDSNLHQWYGEKIEPPGIYFVLKTE